MKTKVALFRSLVALFSIALLSTGCVTSVEVREPVAETVLLVSKSGYTAVLQWDSEIHSVYTILAAPTRKASAKWTPLPGYVGIRGTGQTITVRDKIPKGATRNYRLHVERATGRR